MADTPPHLGDNKDHAGRFTSSLTDEGRYELLINAIHDYAIYMLDPSGIVSSWNPGAQRFKGYTADEIIGQHFSRFYTEDDRAQGLPATALMIADTEGRFEREGWRVRKDGSRFWAQVVIDPIRNTAGQIVGFAKVTRDLTERRAAEAALRISEQRFRLLVQGVTDYAIYMLDPVGFITNWNAGAQRIKQYSAQDVIGTHFSRFYPAEDQARGLPQMGLETAARVGRWEQEGRRVRKDGSLFWAHVIIDAIRDETGEIIGFAKITRDITERVAAQQALDQTREALLQSQKLEAIGQLTGGVAHDFNNLLAAILGSLDLVRKRLPEDPRITPLIDNAIEGAARGASLTQRMLAFARKQELKLEAVDAAALIDGMSGFLNRTIGAAVQIETRFPATLPKVRTDPAQLESAILNLAVNARDAMPSGGSILVEAVEEDALEGDLLSAGRYVRLSVSDTGEGMDEETLARASEPFFTTKGVGKGTGLGLSMVHGLAVQSGGKLEINSQAGVGTTVGIWLPVAAEEDVAAAAQPTAPPVHGPQQPLVILAVDDDALVLRNTTALLEDLGHIVLTAADGEEAIAVARRHPEIELVITDQIMPGLSGLQLIERLHEFNPGLPAVIATGFADLPATVPVDGLRLPKPFSQDELAQAISQATTPPAVTP